MERIIIEVSADTAKRWRSASKETKQRISQIMNIIIAKELMTDSPDEFQEFLDEFRNTMEERGLTQEILQEILNEED